MDDIDFFASAEVLASCEALERSCYQARPPLVDKSNVNPNNINCCGEQPSLPLPPTCSDPSGPPPPPAPPVTTLSRLVAPPPPPSQLPPFPGTAVGGSHLTPPSSLSLAAAAPPPTPQRPMAMEPQGPLPIQSTISLDTLFLDRMGLPKVLLDSYKRRGVQRPYPWQVECLEQPGVLDQGRNLLYCAPTSGGKSLVAEVLMLRRVMLSRKKALVVLPFVSVVQEKVKHLRSVLYALNQLLPRRQRVKVRPFHGSKGGKFSGKGHIAVCTIEKANAVVNKLMEDGQLDKLCCVILDELHMINDKHRGYLLELLVSKLTYVQQREALTCMPEGVTRLDLQIIGMSATLPNTREVADWMRAVLYETSFRPVPLDERYKVGQKVFDAMGRLVRTLYPPPHKERDPDHIVTLALETCKAGEQVLLFCPSRKQCETCTLILARGFTAAAAVLATPPAIQAARKGITAELAKAPAGLDPVLAASLEAGVAFHHAGLTDQERALIEDGFRDGKTIVALVATSTLGAGVNLPAARVVFRSFNMGPDKMDSQSYRQMAGRAGRAGQAARGESILILQPKEVEQATKCMLAPLPPLTSCLSPERDGGRALVRTLLEAIASGALTQHDQLQDFLACTLYACQEPLEALRFGTQALSYLLDNDMVQRGGDTGHQLTPSKLGRAVFRSSFSPEEALVVFKDLDQARRGLNLEDQLHMLYLVTPVNSPIPFSAEGLWKAYNSSHANGPRVREVAERIGLTEQLLHSYSLNPPPKPRGIDKLLSQPEVGDARPKSGPINSKVAAEKKLSLKRASRLWAALVLLGSLQGQRVSTDVSRGDLQTFLDGCKCYAGMVHSFLTQLDWTLLAKLVGDASLRLSGKVDKELLPLLQIPKMTPQLARVLYDAGIHDLRSLACEAVPKLAHVLQLHRPFQTGAAPTPSAEQHRFLREAHWLVSTAKGILKEEDKERKARTRRLLAVCSLDRQGGGGEAGTDSDEDEDDDDDDNEEGEEEGKSQDVMDRDEDPDDYDDGDNGGCEGGEAEGSSEWYQGGASAAGRKDTGGALQSPCPREGQNCMQRLGGFNTAMLETPAFIRCPVFSQGGDPRIIRTPQPLPSSSDHYLYCGEIPAKPKGLPTDSPGPAFEACRHLVERTPGSLVLESSTFVPTALEGTTPQHVSPFMPPRRGQPSHSCRDFVQRWFNAPCFSFSLYFRPRPLPWPHRPQEKDIIRYFETSSLPTLPVDRGLPGSYEPDSSEVHILCGIAMSFQGQQSYYWSLLPPFPPRPETFMRGCLGDKGDEEPTTRKLPYRAPTNPSRPDMVEAQDCSPLQSLPENSVQRIFSYLGYSHDGLRSDVTERYRQVVPLNPGFLLCRRWNRIGCGWFNEKVSNNMWYVLKKVMTNEASCKVSWEMVKAMAALKERGITVKGWAEDPKVALWLLARSETGGGGKANGSKKKVSKRPFLKLPQPSTELHGMCYQAAGLLQYMAAVEVELCKHQLGDPFTLIEMPLVAVLADMQHNGMRVSLAKIVDALAIVQERLMLLEESLKDMGTPPTFNPNSPSSVHDFLYRDLGLHPPKGWSRQGRLPSASLKDNDGIKKAPQVLGPTSAPWLQHIIDQHPAVKAIMQWRSLEGALKRLVNLAQHAMPHYALGSIRIRAQVDPTGSSTGRVIITQPPLQQILHEINVYGPQRPSLQDELEKGWQEGRPPDIPKPGEAPLWDEDDAYSQGLIVTVLRATAAGNWLSNRKKRQLVLPWIPQYGLLRAILPHTIDQPFELHKDEGQGEEEGQGLEGATMMSSGSLADYWKEKGFAYTKEEEARIRQVVVEVRMDAFRRARTNYDDDGGIDALPPTLTLTYPADKVFRRPYRAYQPSSPSQSLQTSGSSTQVQAVGTVPIVGVNTTVTAVSHRSRPGRYPPTTMTLSEELEGHEEDGPSMEGEEGEEEEVMVYNDQEEDDDDMGHGEGEEKLLLRPRQAFIAPEGYVLVSADYCQIELRILAHFSGDGNLCSAISSGEDVFKTLAANWHHVREEEVTAAQRKHAKTIAYGIIYGQGVAALAKRLEVSPNQAAALRTSFLEAYPGITTFVEDTKANCRSRGYVETLLGRRRYLPNINSPDKDKAAHAQRQSVNTKCQGSAADLIKLAMINIHRRLDKELQAAPGLPSSSSNTIVASALPSSRPCRLVLQVHDELVFEVDHRWLPRVVPIIRDSMQRAVRLQVPLKVQIRKGHNWSDLSPLLT